MSRTSQRLQFIVDEIEPNSVIADIGTDHGYLPIMAVMQNKVDLAYASDIAEKPLTSAIENIANAKLDQKITTVLSDGLDFYKKRNIHLDYAVIAGLGSSTIRDILKNDYQNIDTYLICSNTEPSAVLRLSKKLKLKVQKEIFFVDGGRNYWLIKLNRTNGTKIKSFIDINLGIGEILNSQTYREYLINEYKRNEEILSHLHLSKRYLYLKKLNRNIKKVISDGTK